MESNSRCNGSGGSRRSFLQLGAAGTAALASGIVGESFFAASARASSLPRGPFPKDAEQQGLKPEYVRTFPGSGEPLHFTVLAFTSAAKSYVTADPGYEAGMHAAKVSGARVVKTPLTATHAHDVKAMLGAAPDAGVFYICSPNNPTGTLTPHADIEFLLEHKPKGSVVLVDEAYIHFSDGVTA